jgi:hypothetical protein
MRWEGGGGVLLREATGCHQTGSTVLQTISIPTALEILDKYLTFPNIFEASFDSMDQQHKFESRIKLEILSITVLTEIHKIKTKSVSFVW